ncbi:MAG TPA: ABC transporter ATP-binding protein [Polyangiaceae bacterium]|nr:ABC transporter ATP-binding protein [Polyangiaceae bacterium]
MSVQPDLPAQLPRATVDDSAAVRLTRVTKTFGSNRAVDDVTLAIAMGTVFGLIGPNGAGKTTTFSMLAGYLRPSAGRIEVFGLAPSRVDALRGRLGVLPQDALLPDRDTVGEFLVCMARLQDLPPRQAAAFAREALDLVGGSAWWRQRCSSLSHGMAKRVALAQAFLGEPDLVLLDEPTAGLDPRAMWEIRQIVKAKRGARTIVVSSHNLHELEEICDAAAILDRGRVVASGSMTELTAAHEEIRVKVPAGTLRGSKPGQVPVQALRELPSVKSAELDEQRLEIVICFDRAETDAEAVIARLLRVLLDHEVRISGVAKGRGLEQRVMSLT